MPKQAMDLPTLVSTFSDEDACHAYLEELRWPDGVSCPGRKRQDGTREDCGSRKLARLEERRLFECMGCGYQFSTRVGTIFEDSKLPLWKWFLAVFMMAESKKGISAKQIERMLAVSYKTAWYLCHRVREAMKDEDAKPLTGTVEVDETFIGGKRRWEERLANKTVVMAAVERGGRVRLKKVASRKIGDVRDFVNEAVSKDAKSVYTDDYKAYRRLFPKQVHEHVRHSPLHKRQKDGSIRTSIEWVRGKIHTNTVEGVFSLLDRSIIGAYHKVSTKHLPRYLSEVEWRYNNRKNPYLFRDTILELIRADHIEYGTLVGHSKMAL